MWAGKYLEGMISRAVRIWRTGWAGPAGSGRAETAPREATLGMRPLGPEDARVSLSLSLPLSLSLSSLSLPSLLFLLLSSFFIITSFVLPSFSLSPFLLSLSLSLSLSVYMSLSLCLSLSLSLSPVDAQVLDLGECGGAAPADGGGGRRVAALLRPPTCSPGGAVAAAFAVFGKAARDPSQVRGCLVLRAPVRTPPPPTHPTSTPTTPPRSSPPTPYPLFSEALHQTWWADDRTQLCLTRPARRWRPYQ
jgi:hypothetical protein